MIHPAHDGHDIRCVTYDCTHENHDDQHVMRCITCHTWADEDPTPSKTRLARIEAEIEQRIEAETTTPVDQPALFEVTC